MSLIKVCERVPRWGHFKDPKKTTLYPLFTSLCTGELNAIRKQKGFLCRSFLRNCVSLAYVGRNQNLKDLKDGGERPTGLAPDGPSPAAPACSKCSCLVWSCLLVGSYTRCGRIRDGANLDKRGTDPKMDSEKEPCWVLPSSRVRGCEGPSHWCLGCLRSKTPCAPPCLPSTEILLITRPA